MSAKNILVIVIGFVLLVAAIAWSVVHDDGQPIASHVAGTTPPSTTPEMTATTNPVVSRVGEPPDTSVPPGEVPNAAQNPASVGIVPCKVFTNEEVQARFGKSITAARPTGGGTGCEYVMGGPAGGPAVLFVISRGDTATKYVTTLKDVRASVTGVEELTNIGDEAFVYGTSTDGLTNAEARRGSLRFRVLVRGDGKARDKAVGMLEEALRRTPKV